MDEGKWFSFGKDGGGLRVTAFAKVFLIFFVFSLIIVPTSNAANKNASPQIKAEEPFWDFGFVPFDYDMVHFFKITNAGNAKLKIKHVASSCDCTTARALDTIISPGESTKIRVDFWTTDYYGSNIREVTIESNDPATPELVLQYNSNIGALPTAFSAEPKSLFYLPSHDEKLIQFHNRTSKPATIVITPESDSILVFDRLEGEIPAGGDLPVNILVGARAKKGTTYTSFNVLFKGEKPIQTTVPVKIVRY